VLADTQRLLPTRAARAVRCWDGGDIIVITDGPAARPGNSSPAGSSPSGKTWTAPFGWATTIPAAWYGPVEVRPVGETLT
jgi:hypothetical protein